MDNKEVLAEFQERLDKYARDEKIEQYDRLVFINDILFFLGNAIDSEKFNWSPGYNKFVATVIYPIALRAHEAQKANFKRKLGNGE